MLAWTEEVRIGSIDEAEYTFTQILRVTIGPDDRAYLAQWQIPEVWAYEADGTFAGRIGRGGEGPGELMSVGDLGWIGDSLWVSDFMAASLSLYDREGRYLDRVHFSVPFPVGWSSFHPRAPLADGTILGSPGFTTDAVLRGQLDRVPQIRFSRDGTGIDTLAWRTLRREVMQVDLGRGQMLHGKHVLPGSTFFALDPAGTEAVVVDPEPTDSDAVFRLGKIGISGDTLLWREVPYEPIPLSDEALRQIISKQYAENEWLHDRLTQAAYQSAFLEGFERPRAFPPVSDVLVNRDGTIWLCREAMPFDSSRWDVFGAEGEVQAVLVLPSGLRVMAVQDDRVWAVESDELDVQYLIRLRVEPAG